MCNLNNQIWSPVKPQLKKKNSYFKSKCVSGSDTCYVEILEVFDLKNMLEHQKYLKWKIFSLKLCPFGLDQDNNFYLISLSILITCLLYNV